MVVVFIFLTFNNYVLRLLLIIADVIFWLKNYFNNTVASYKKSLFYPRQETQRNIKEYFIIPATFIQDTEREKQFFLYCEEETLLKYPERWKCANHERRSLNYFRSTF